MAIQFARVERVSRGGGKNACCKGSYNARNEITDQKTNVTYNFSDRKDNVYHEILLPDYVDSKFKLTTNLMNLVEESERKNNSQLLKEYVLALPDDANISLDAKKKMVAEFVRQNEWVKEGLGVQIDIHSPHKDEMNWHAHILVTTRRFLDTGLGFETKKARDLEPQVRGGRDNTYVKSKEATNLGKLWSVIQNDYFKKHGLDNRVDAISLSPQEHVGAVRMRSVFNEAARRNEERRETEVEHLNSGSGVLDKVTKHMSVFTKGDLIRAVKCIPDSEARTRLVEDAISDKSVVPLYREEGNKTQYFTTKEVRDEENKIVRLSQYVANENNVFVSVTGKGVSYSKQLIDISKKTGLSEEQGVALSNLILSKSGIRILRGRAGAGKSHVLKQIPFIAESAGINVIGIAPTHKAKVELASDGFGSTDTIKGMLFKLANGRFALPKHSLIVVDEAGMVGNDDMGELLRVAATRKCNVILAGDEKQLASVQRGGLFEIFADRYGSSTILDIKRQESDWGKSVAMNMSAGNVETAISILNVENRIKWDTDENSSMSTLLSDWSKSDHNISDRIILAVKNTDVAAINHGARQYLKSDGRLKGEEIAVAGNHYMQGDRILITKTNKGLGVINGDLAELVSVSENQFTIKLNVQGVEQDKKISFNPSEYNGFRHGYATTIFKAQGASIADVYMFHNGFAGIRNSYVSLSRNKIDLNLYTNKDSTSNLNSLIRQLSQDAEAGSSLGYLTAKELENKEISHRLANDKNRFVRGVNSLIDFASNTATKFTDKYIPSSQYYNYKEPKQKYEPAQRVIDTIFAQAEGHNLAIIEEKLVVGANALNSPDKSKAISSAVFSNVSSKSTNNQEVAANSDQITGLDKIRQSAKTRFYANADRIRSQQQYQAQKEKWGIEYDQLKSELKFKAEVIARDLLGNPNKNLSNGQELRFGDQGKLAVRITGEKAGTWYDFSKGEGGDLFHLVQETKNSSFKEAAEYLRGQIGMSSSTHTKPNLQLVRDHENSDLTIDRIKNNQKEERLHEKKQAYSVKLYERSKDIGKKSVAHRYLSGIRSINVDLGDDIKTAGIYEKSNKGYLPALLAYARDRDGNITGGQHLLLDKKTNTKADIDHPKKSFGIISGSFVDLGNVNTKSIADDIAENSKKSEITIIAEGLETGLSIKQSLLKQSKIDEAITANISIKTLCSLGIGNIKNYEPEQGQKIIIASDNDGNNLITEKTIENAKASLENKGAFVEIVKPTIEGDFNDVLQDKANNGSKVIADCFQGAIAKHSARTLEEYIPNIDTTKNSKGENIHHLSSQDKVNLGIVKKYNISQENILNAWRGSPNKGREELISSSLEISVTEKNLEANRDILDLAANHGIKIDEKHLVKTLFTSVASSSQECINHALLGFTKQKQESEKIGHVFNIIKKEDQFLFEVNINNKKELDKNLEDRLALSKTNQSKDIIANIKQNIEANHKQGIISYDDLLKKVIAGGYDIKGLDVSLNQLAVNGRVKYLEAISIELNALKELKCNPDQDKLVGSLKSMSYKEREQHGDQVLGAAAKQHIEPMLNKYNNERNNAGDFWKFLNVVTKEQEAYKGLYSKHRFALRSLDRQNGDLKFSTIASSASQMDKRFSTNGMISMLGFAVKNKIVNPDKITKEINLRSGNLSSIYYSTKNMCDRYKSEQAKNNMQKQNSIEKVKQPEIKIDKGFSM